MSPAPDPLPTTRPATEADLPFLATLRRARTPPVDEARLDAELREQLPGTAVVELAGRPVGLLRVQRGASRWTIQQVQLLPAWRRAGIGSRLIAALLDEARAQGVRVNLSVLKSNPALALYERMGFVVTTECENGYGMQAAP